MALVAVRSTAAVVLLIHDLLLIPLCVFACNHLLDITFNIFGLYAKCMFSNSK